MVSATDFSLIPSLTRKIPATPQQTNTADWRISELIIIEPLGY